MENDLIFGAETTDAVFDAADDVTQIAAVATPIEEAMPTPRDAAQVVVAPGENVVRVSVAPGEVVELPFPADAHFLARLEDGNLAIKVGGLTIILEGYADAAGQAMPVIEAANGQPLDIAAILAATDPAIEIETAAGAAGAQGQGADNTGAILTQFGGAAGGLGGFTGAGGQEGSDAPTGGPGVDQTGTLFRQFGGAPVPTAPNAPDFKFTTDEESGITRKVVATDPQGDVLTYAVVGAPPAGLTFNPDGTWVFDPVGKYDQLNTDNPGQVSFQYKANDGANDSNTATVTIDIAGVNDAPMLTSGTVGVGFFEDTSDSRELGWKIADPDDTDITISVDPSTLPPGVTYDSSTGTIQYEAGHYEYLKADENAHFNVKFTVSDAHGGSFEQNLGVDIIGENDAPVAGDDTVLTNIGALGTFVVPDWALLANDKDVDSTGLYVFPRFPGTGLEHLGHFSGAGNDHFEVEDDATLGGSFDYRAVDESDESNLATVTIQNQERGDITGTGADEILIGTGLEQTLDGGGGNDILIGSGFNGLSGGSGDDILVGLDRKGSYHGGTDSVASSGGLAADGDNHGDVLVVRNAAVDLADSVGRPVDGIETISTQARLGSVGTQSLTISAAIVQQLSDHTITPGGGFGEHDAIRIDGDAVDQITLSRDGGKWVDTAIEMAGYRVYAHETSAGDPASTDAYVMVQAANVGNVHLNPPVAGDDRILTTVGTNAEFSVPEWALLANDTGDTKLDLAGVVDYTGLSMISWNTAAGTNENVDVSEDAAPGGSFEYQATDGETLSKSATVSIFNAPGGIGSTDADEILVGSTASEILAGNGGNDIIFSGGVGDEIYGGDGDDIIELNQPAHIYGSIDSVAQSGGLAASANNHGDVLIRATNLSLVDVTNIESVETISTEEKFGGVGAQTVTIDAASVRSLSDHTITPGGGFGEHDAIRIDGDSVDRLYLSTGADGGQWVDTSIEVAGYRVYAHETTDGDPASTDAYVMVQAANAGNVRLNQDGAPVAGNDSVLTNAGASGTLVVPEWALLANDKTVDGAKLTVDPDVYGATGFQGVAHKIGGSFGAYELTDNAVLGGEFGYKASDGGVLSQVAIVDVQNQAGGAITGTDADEILVGTAFGEKIDGGGGNDIIFGVDGQRDEIFGGAGDDVVDFVNLGSSFHGGTDTVASSGGLASSMHAHGDVLIRSSDLDLANSVFAADLDGIETISTQEKFGAVGPQTITIGAASVRQLSDHTITPGGGFGEHDAIRIDGDNVDQVYLSTSADGGQWVDTAIEMAGYRIYAHETTGGDPASTDAYVMVQAANVGQVRFAPIAGNDTVLTNVGTEITFAVPEWALLANDTGGKDLDVSVGFNGFSGLNGLTHIPEVGSEGKFDVDEDETLGGSFEYKATNGIEESGFATVSFHNQAGGDITGTAAHEIIVSGAGGDKIDGKGGKDLIFGGAGDDTVIFHDGDTVQGGLDSVTKNNALADSPTRGDVLGLDHDVDFTTLDLAHFSSIETISTLNSDAGGAGAQSLTIGAGTVTGISDHTITPGGLFAEHRAVRIDGDTVDQLYLSISKDGGKWVDTSITEAGYHIFAHETSGGDPASTDAYVMVQASNVGNVQLNQDAP